MFGCLLVALLMIQFGYLKYATGYFRAINLHSERFSFFDPYTFKFLFSYKKGWLLYTPIMVFAILGFYFLRTRRKEFWLPMVLLFVLNLYVVSSWECWWYAASFSQRPMVESYALMLFPMGAFLQQCLDWSGWKRYATLLVLGLLVLFNLFQTWQYVNYLIDPEHMTKAYYWRVFLKTSNTLEDRTYLSIDHNQDVFLDYANYQGKYMKKDVGTMDFELTDTRFEASRLIDTIASSGKKSYLLDESKAFSPEFKAAYSDITHKSYVWVHASVMVYLTAPVEESNSCLVMTTESRGKAIKYCTKEAIAVKPEPGKWTKIELDMLTPEIRHDNDQIKVYYWNMGGKPLMIDDLKVEIFEPIVDNE